MGHHIAMCNLARQLWTEELKRYADALPLFMESAKWGCAEAQYGLAVMFYEGLGVEKDTNESWKWLEKSINFGCNEARALLSHICMNEDMATILHGSAEVFRAQNYAELFAAQEGNNRT